MREDRFLEKGRGNRTLLPEEGRKEEEGGVRSDYPLKNENPEKQWQKLKARELWQFPLFPVLYFRKGQPYKTTTPNKGLLQTQ